jgi:hypothetical protein
VNSYRNGSINLSFPSNAFYRSFDFIFSESPGDSTTYAPVYHVHNKFVPVQKSFTISIQPESFPEDIHDQLYIAILGDNGSHWYIGSDWKENRITAKSRLLGDYTIKADTIDPEIIPVNVKDGKNISGQGTIKVKIRDSETGIKRFRVTLNDQWILTEYEPKKSLLFYNFDDRIKKGENRLKVVVSDRLGNETVYEAELTY